MENPQAALQLFKRELVGGLFGFHTPNEIRNRQPDLDFLFAAAGEVEIEAGLDLGRDRFFAQRWNLLVKLVSGTRRPAMR